MENSADKMVQTKIAFNWQKKIESDICSQTKTSDCESQMEEDIGCARVDKDSTKQPNQESIDPQGTKIESCRPKTRRLDPADKAPLAYKNQ